MNMEKKEEVKKIRELPQLPRHRVLSLPIFDLSSPSEDTNEAVLVERNQTTSIILQFRSIFLTQAAVHNGDDTATL